MEKNNTMKNKLFIYSIIMLLLVPYIALADVDYNNPSWTLGSSGGTSYALGLNFTVNQENVYLVSATRYSGATPPIAVLFEDMVRVVNTTTLLGDNLTFDPPVPLTMGKSYQIVGGDNTQAYTRNWDSQVGWAYGFSHIDLESGCDLAFVGDDFRAYCNNQPVAYNFQGLSTIILLPVVSNSTWNVTTPYVDGNRTRWDTGGKVNITYNSLAITVSTSVNTNMTCDLDVERNYTEMLLYNIQTKAATTETTSHSITLFENISLGEHCVYCSFITPSGIGGESGCLNISRKDVQTPFKVADFGGVPFTYSSTSFITGFSKSFNVTSDGEFVFLSAFNVQKLSGGTSSETVFSRILVDGIAQPPEVVRTVSSVNDFGSSGLDPLIKNLSVGSHNISFQFRSSNIFNTRISNIDIVAMKLEGMKENKSLVHGFRKGSISFDNANYTLLLNETFNSYLESGVYSLFSYKLFGGTGTFSTYITDDNLKSPYSKRALSSNVGAGLLTFHDNVEDKTHNISVFVRENATGSATLNYSLLRINTRINNSYLIRLNHSSNTTTNLSNTLTFSAGTHELLSVNVSDSGNNIFYIAHASMQAVNTNAALTVTVDNSDCKTSKNRTFTSNSAGVVYLYGTCSSSDNIVRLNVESNGEVVVFDEGLDVFNTVLYNVGDQPLPPLKGSIIYPTVNQSVFGMNTIDWNEFSDPNDDLVLYNLSLVNVSSHLTLYDLGGVAAGTTSLIVNWGDYNIGNYTLNVMGVDSLGFTVNNSVNFTIINTTNALNLTHPVDGFSSFVTNITFEWFSNTGGDCSLRVNGTDFKNVSGVVGANVLDYDFVFVNKSYSWNIFCTSGGVTWSGSSRVVNLDLNDKFGDAFSVTSCPIDSTAMALLFGMLLLCSLLFILIGFLGDVGFMGLFGGIMMFVLSWYTFACIGAIAWVLMGASLVLIIYFPTKSFKS